MPNSKLTTERLYEEASDSFRYIVDWRYKILTRYFISSTAFVLAAKWIGEIVAKDRPWIIAIPLLFGAISCLAFFAMDRRNKRLIDACNSIASDLEAGLGVYTEWSKLSQHRWPPSYDVHLGDHLHFLLRPVWLVCFVGSYVLYPLAKKTLNGCHSPNANGRGNSPI